MQGKARVLFDSGSHKSFVTAKAALKYELPIQRKEWIRISTFGQIGKESGLREIVRFDIMPLCGGRGQALEAYFWPEISRMQNTEIPTRTVPRRNATLDCTWKSILVLDS